MNRINTVRLHRLRVPLKAPYELAIARVEAFDTVLTEVELADGAYGFGEATVLTGYTHETMGQCWSLAGTLAQQICGLSPDAANGLLEKHMGRAPFTVTALVTAVEMARDPGLLSDNNVRRVPLVAVVQGHGAAALEREIEEGLAAGYRTFKVKVGFNVDADLARVGEIQGLLAGRGMIRIDANQGYSKNDACRFASELDPSGIELLEQTCDADDWEAARIVTDIARVPTMLDESIYDISDVEKTAELGAANFIKFKLMKAGGLSFLRDALRRIRALNMTPVLGNGVACDVSCWMEACIASSEMDNTGEMNGFLKMQHNLFADPLQVADGMIEIPATYVPVLNHDVVTRYRTGFVELR